jgi:predicted PurR-regulated permease PerM
LSPSPGAEDKQFVARALEAAIRIGLVVLLAAWCFEIIRPFIIPLMWGIIIAIASHPGYRWLRAALGGRNALAAAAFALIALAGLIAPAVLLAGTLVDTAQGLADDLNQGTIKVPPPPASVENWPIIGKPLEQFWLLASVNLGEALTEIGPHLKGFGSWLVAAAAGTGLGILQFIIAIVIAAVFLARARFSHEVATAIATRLAGERGAEYADLAGATIRSVARGILGVALIQSLLAGLGFLAVGLPAAGFLALLCLLLAVIQIGVGPIVIPVIIYVFATADTLTAMLFLIWSIAVIVSDNILKPILLGRGVQVPMTVIFIGAIGGFLTSGIVGLFVGAVVLALGYTLFLAWLQGGSTAAATPGDMPVDTSLRAAAMAPLAGSEPPIAAAEAPATAPLQGPESSV